MHNLHTPCWGRQPQFLLDADESGVRPSPLSPLDPIAKRLSGSAAQRDLLVQYLAQVRLAYAADVREGCLGDAFVGHSAFDFIKIEPGSH